MSDDTTATPDVQAPGRPGHERPRRQASHGMSVAAWVACGGVMLGTLVAAIGLVLAPFNLAGGVLVAILGGVIAVAAALAGPVLVRAGYGEHTEIREYTGGPRAIR